MSDVSDTDATNRSPPLPDPERKLVRRLRNSEMVEELMVIKLRVSDVIF